MKIGVLKSQKSPMVGAVPAIVAKYKKDGHEVWIEHGSGDEAFFTDATFIAVDAQIKSRAEILSHSDILLVDEWIAEAEFMQLNPEQMLIGRFGVLNHPKFAEKLQQAPCKVFSLDMVPRSSIAQSMDVLSSLASLAGYKAVIVAANHFPGYFPMMTTAAGTVPPAKVLVLGAGVAGLQAIATAKRLGASVEAFDVRSAVKEEVQSLGAKFVEVEGSQEDVAAGGYAVEQSKDYVERQKRLIHERATKADVVITTASIPGRKAPLLLEEETVKAMGAGSVIIDMAAATGGNCAFTQNQCTVCIGETTIIGDSALFNLLPREASRLYSTNLYHFIKFMLKDGAEAIPYEHEVISKTLLNSLVSEPEI